MWRAIVTANGGQISWTRKTRLWTRTRHIATEKVTEISASTDWLGFGRVCVKDKRWRHVVLEELMAENAVRFARELREEIGLGK